jgi:hypothetical protein
MCEREENGCGVRVAIVTGNRTRSVDQSAVNGDAQNPDADGEMKGREFKGCGNLTFHESVRVRRARHQGVSSQRGLISQSIQKDVHRPTV